MRTLVVAATESEIAPLLLHRPDDLDILITGVGMVATAAHCSRALTAGGYGLVLNLGVCGSFDPALTPGMVVHVTSDRLPELGAEDGDRFLSIHELGLLGEHESPFEGGALVNTRPPVNAIIASLPAVSGITVNTVHGSETSIRRVVQRLRPQVESMEGAAFMYACLIHEVPFAQVRAVSNVVEKRNRAAWKIPEAIAALNDVALRILGTPEGAPYAR
jgi:futalosine hydrolase